MLQAAISIVKYHLLMTFLFLKKKLEIIYLEPATYSEHKQKDAKDFFHLQTILHFHMKKLHEFSVKRL